MFISIEKLRISLKFLTYFILLLMITLLQHKLLSVQLLLNIKTSFS